MSQYTLKMTLPRREAVWESRDVNPRISNFKIRCRWMVSFTRRPLNLSGKSPLHIEQKGQWDAESF
jgi:hypothetical protein